MVSSRISEIEGALSDKHGRVNLERMMIVYTATNSEEIGGIIEFDPVNFVFVKSFDRDYSRFADMLTVDNYSIARQAASELKKFVRDRSSRISSFSNPILAEELYSRLCELEQCPCFPLAKIVSRALHGFAISEHRVASSSQTSWHYHNVNVLWSKADLEKHKSSGPEALSVLFVNEEETWSVYAMEGNKEHKIGTYQKILDIPPSSEISENIAYEEKLLTSALQNFPRLINGRWRW